MVYVFCPLAHHVNQQQIFSNKLSVPIQKYDVFLDGHVEATDGCTYGRNNHYSPTLPVIKTRCLQVG